MTEFNYISEKIASAQFHLEPFSHIYIEDFLSEEHFRLISQDNQIKVPEFTSTESLIDGLIASGYEVQPFAGCTTSIEDYLQHLNADKWPSDGRNRVEGFGITLRLKKFENQRIKQLIYFLNSRKFHRVLEDKFDIKKENTIETAIQKYLTGYEISPHPDIRRKCLTYLVNVNPTDTAEKEAIHTHLMEVKSNKRFVYDFWEKNKQYDTDWIPWDWCETKKIVSKNNSIIMFKPSFNTLHAVKLKYDHLNYQRTQIYGNLWYADNPTGRKFQYESIESEHLKTLGFFNKLKFKLGSYAGIYPRPAPPH